MAAAYLRVAQFSLRRSPGCGKVQHDSREMALRASRLTGMSMPKAEAIRVAQIGKGRFKPYKCRYCDGAWHVGHS